MAELCTTTMDVTKDVSSNLDFARGVVAADRCVKIQPVASTGGSTGATQDGSTGAGQEGGGVVDPDRDPICLAISRVDELLVGENNRLGCSRQWHHQALGLAVSVRRCLAQARRGRGGWTKGSS